MKPICRTGACADCRTPHRGFLLLLSIIAFSALDGARAASPFQAEVPQTVLAMNPSADYYLTPLSDDRLASSVAINGRGEVAFTELFRRPEPGAYRARLYDGHHTRTLGTFGGASARTFALSPDGQVVGFADVKPNPDPFNSFHAFRSSPAAGLVDLSKGVLRASYATAINKASEVVGAAVFNPAIDVAHATRWNACNRAQDLGTLAGGMSSATGINNAGVVIGWSDAPQAPSQHIAIRWTQERHMQALSPFAGPETQAWDVNEAGAIVGAAPLREGGPERAFLWTPPATLIDLGAGNGGLSRATRINENGMVIGTFINRQGIGRGFVWTRASGAIDIGSSPDVPSNALDLNDHGQVVGSIDGHAYLWEQGRSLVDLNARLRNAPHGLVLREANAINDRGEIVATTNTGLVLLSAHPGTNVRPLAGPIIITGPPQAGHLLSMSLSFTDIDVYDTHTATWDWGEGAPEKGVVSERNGSGSVSGQHTYLASGEFTVRLTLSDSNDKHTTVTLDIVILEGPSRFP